MAAALVADVPASEPVAELIVGQVRQARDSERRHAAREIHDRLGYWLSLARVELELYELHQHRDPDRGCANLTMAREAIAEGLAEIRRMVTELRSPHVVDGLEQALLLVAGAVAPASSVVEVVVEGDEHELPEHMRSELYLVLREALRNAFAHADPATVTVLVDISASRVQASVIDDGRGFDPETAAPGAGIASMRERIELLGGSISITSARRRGCSVEILLQT
jgi:signal transduction histidine kinase